MAVVALAAAVLLGACQPAAELTPPGADDAHDDGGGGNLDEPAEPETPRQQEPDAQGDHEDGPEPDDGNGDDDGAPSEDDPGADDPPEVSDHDGPDEDEQQAARHYFEAYATHDALEMSEMIEASAAGSAAHLYGHLQTAVTRADQQSGFQLDPYEIAEHDTGYELCLLQGELNCVSFQNIEFDAGLVSDFTINGEQLPGRLAEPGTVDERGGVVVTLLGGYRSITGRFVIAVEVTNSGTETVSIYPWSAEYVTGDGQQFRVDDAVGPHTVRGGATATVTVFIERQDPGGTLYLAGSDPALAPIEWRVAVELWQPDSSPSAPVAAGSCARAPRCANALLSVTSTVDVDRWPPSPDETGRPATRTRSCVASPCVSLPAGSLAPRGDLGRA